MSAGILVSSQVGHFASLLPYLGMAGVAVDLHGLVVATKNRRSLCSTPTARWDVESSFASEWLWSEFCWRHLVHSLHVHMRASQVPQEEWKSLDQMLQLYADDMDLLLNTGVESSDGLLIRCCHLGNKGDLPALARAGHMLHTFIQQCSACRVFPEAMPCQGVCWMCKAGQAKQPIAFGSSSC